MRFFWCMVMLTVALFVGAPELRAEMMPDEPGTVKTYLSDNGKYAVSIMFGEGGMTSWSLKEDGKELWSGPFMDEPGQAVVADNGETIIMPLWGWRDEGGSKGVAVYNKKGDLVREVLFEGPTPGEETLKWVKVTKISPDGKYFAVGEGSKEGARITLYDAASGKIVWEKTGGYSEMTDINISGEGKYVLVATHEDKGTGGMTFLLFDNKGDILWQKAIDKNFSHDVEKYLNFTDNDSKVEVFDVSSGKYLSEAIPTRD